MNVHKQISIRNAYSYELDEIGNLMVNVYSKLKGFPNQQEQPKYYSKLQNVGKLTQNKNTELLVAIYDTKIVGAVVFFSDLTYYGSGGTIANIKNAAGFRLLSVAPQIRGFGIGKKLSNECIKKAKNLRKEAVYIHSTKSMKIAWEMYENLGFKRYKPIDFMQGTLQVYGFRLKL